MDKVIQMIIDSYIKVMGSEKWNSLTGAEQRLVIVTIAKDMTEAIDRL